MTAGDTTNASATGEQTQAAPAEGSAPRATGPTERLESIRPYLPREFTARLVDQLTVGSNPQSVEIVAPLTGETIVDLPQSGPGDVRHAFEKARAAQAAWAARPVGERAAVLRRLHDLVLDNSEHLLSLIQVETGKTRLHAFDEIGVSVATARHYAHAARGYLRPRRKIGVLPVLTRVTEYRHPKGVVGVITPWNYPLALAAMDILPALVAGNGVVHKPDNQTVLSGLYLRQLAVQAGLPAELWQVVTGDGPVTGPAVVDHADYVAFTGSTRTGRQVAQQAAGRLIGCSLELGGKNAMIVFEDADLDKTVAGAIRACFTSAGQLCISIERMYVHHAVYDRFVDRFVTEVKALKLGSTLDFAADVGSLTNTKQLETVTQQVEDARIKGARVLAGGRRRPDVGPLFYEPTVLTDVAPGMTLYADETFGPVVSLYRFENEAEVLGAANDTRFGLSSSIWTRDAKRAKEAALRVHSGMVNVNEAYAAAFGSVAAATGGMGDSGVGRRSGSEGIWRYTEIQTVARQTLMPIAPSMGLDAARYTKVLGKALRVLKTLRVR
ncbi:succinate-semialdehyde dehydrogenase (NADP(+)) [Actinospica sp. MGRD01-02]|uniref:succinate-semialdehyde dehydrogenase (NADP(+)) n=1 Tax=Actinospica acidithermotolerans TaxID=2828514 RepID=A0A941E732_9ACTN|nr:succinic semialdehyde dehydrogenase [Actinospica acidithermotolerans]MBR7826296.1 succinate-semialdehyde dehydrogenase (NADP(+)) [Actinospica acidithermotolerans]